MDDKYTIDIVFDMGDEPEPEGLSELIELCKPLSAESVALLICDFKKSAEEKNQRIAELEAQLNTRNLAVERDGDPLREKFNDSIAKYTSALSDFMLSESGSEREQDSSKRMHAALDELTARYSTVVDIVRVLVRDNKNAFTENRRYKELQRHCEALIVGGDQVVEGCDWTYAQEALGYIQKWLAEQQVLEGGAE